MSFSDCAVHRFTHLLLLALVFVCKGFPAIKLVARISRETVSLANIALNGSPHEAFFTQSVCFVNGSIQCLLNYSLIEKSVVL